MLNNLKTKMNKILGTILISLAAGLVIFSCLGIGTPIQASKEDNTSGWAWSENIGWISFNSVSDGSSIDYGVSIDQATGKLSGYAWSENIGWISFERSQTGPPPFNDPCPDGTCIAIAKANPPGQLGQSDVPIIGWARALSYGDGWDGWIRFDHGKSNESYIDANGNWHGWAWGSDVVGWISFNNTDPNAGGSSYKVKTSLSTLSVSLSANPSSGNAPLSNVGLMADVSGTAAGDITYKFDCENDGTYEKTITTSADSYTAWNLCDYSSAGTYTAKVVVERGSLNAADTATIKVNVPPPVPTADIKANGSDGPITVDVGTSVNISWTSTDADSCVVSPPGWTGVSGSRSTDNLTHDVTYTLNCSGPGGKASDSVTINVNYPLPSWKEIPPW